MKRALAIIHRPGEDDEFRVVMYPEFKEPGFYRQALSLDAFKNREAFRLYHHQQKHGLEKITWASIKYESDFLGPMDLKFWTGGKDWGDIPASPDVWQFYKDIGYDYKKKKYQ